MPISVKLHVVLITFIDDKHADPELPAEVVEEGTKIIEDLLRTWAANTSEQDGEDIVMADDDADSAAAELAELKKCFEQFQPQIESNGWIQSVLASL